jgi:diguanylate cyclase (GGDEF)-like protein/PAS domain S-box-containing protein
MRLNILDMRTILFSYIISNAVCMSAMAYLWLQNRRQITGLGYWLADFILQFTAVLLVGLRGIVPDIISMVVGNGLVILGTILLLIGLERYTGKTGTQLHNFILLAAFVAIHWYFAAVQPNLMARNINLSLGLLLICIQIAWLLLHRVDKKILRYSRVVGIVFVLYCLVNFVRILLETRLPIGNDLFKSGLVDTLAVLIFQMLFIALTYALFLMVSRRLLAELEEDIARRELAEKALKTSEQRFSVAFQNLPDGIVISRIEDGKIIEGNESFHRIAGYSKEETIGKTTIELKLWSQLRDRKQFVKDLQKSGKVTNFETHFRRKSGEVFPGLISGGIIPIFEKNHVLTVIQDVSEQQKTGERLRLDSQMMENISDGIFLYKDSDGEIVYANPQFAKLFGYEPEELIGQPVSILNAPTDITPEEISREIKKSSIKNGVWESEIQNIKKDGSLFWSHASVSSFTHSQYGLVWVTVQQDITKRKKAEMRLEYMGTHDALTGLYNRTFFDEEVRRYERGRQYPISMVMVDLDDLKNINDTKGHLAGDGLLQRTAQVLNESFRGDDIIARIGGDEFAALLPNTDEKAASEALERVRDNVKKTNAVEKETALSISLGVDTAEKGMDLKKVLQQADKNMYVEKSKKK